MVEVLSRSYQKVAVPPLVGLSEIKYTLYPKKGCEVSTEQQRLIIMELGRAVRNRRKVRSSDFIRMGILDGLPEIIGLNRIPRDGGLIIAANHPQAGIVEGLSHIMTIAYAIEQARTDTPIGDSVHDSTAYTRFLETARTESERWRFLREPLNLANAQTFGNFPVDVLGEHKYPYGVNNGLAFVKRGGVLGIFPEGKISYEMITMDPRARMLFSRLPGMVAEEVPIQPIGVWCEKDEDTNRYKYFVHIGETMSPSEARGVNIMWAIAELIPPQLRGVYGRDKSSVIEYRGG